jgi:cystathionine beta-lyase
MQALTKYVGGHSDLLLGSVTVRERAHYDAIGNAHYLLGTGVSPDDCSLALRGLQTLGVRLEQLGKSALDIARWFQQQPEITSVLHPALVGSPGNDIWKRDFTGSASVFSVVFAPTVSHESIIQAIDSLRLFKVGFSWGGVTSLVMPEFELKRRFRSYGSGLVRFNIGLEAVSDLLADLDEAFSSLRSKR